MRKPLNQVLPSTFVEITSLQLCHCQIYRSHYTLLTQGCTNPGHQAARRLNFVQCRPIRVFVGLPAVTFLTSPFWRLEFKVAPRFLKYLCTPVVTHADYMLCIQMPTYSRVSILFALLKYSVPPSYMCIYIKIELNLLKPSGNFTYHQV
jgi:hypothetical protein